MPGATDLATLLRTLEPRLRAEPFVFCTVAPAAHEALGVVPLGLFREDEGVTLILERAAAAAAGLPHELLWACITLTVHSSLTAVGLISAVSARLAAAGISVNPVAAYHHDHLFVPWDARDRALAELVALAAEFAEPGPTPTAALAPPLIERLDGPAARAALPELAALLDDCVRGGASIGFVLPLADGELERYWEGVIAGVEAGHRLLFAARLGGRIVGAVQLAPEPRANGAHRAEIQKLLVHREARRQGLGAALMVAAEAAARAAGRTLLVLDTRVGDDGERVYRRLGYRLAGVIPSYARSPDGASLDGSAFMYKLLGAA
jgi:GNAT superfamily N-acetyltransferase